MMYNLNLAALRFDVITHSAENINYEHLIKLSSIRIDTFTQKTEPAKGFKHGPRTVRKYNTEHSSCIQILPICFQILSLISWEKKIKFSYMLSGLISWKRWNLFPRKAWLSAHSLHVKVTQREFHELHGDFVTSTSGASGYVRPYLLQSTHNPKNTSFLHVFFNFCTARNPCCGVSPLFCTRFS
jgi:hypothetical protein